VSTWIDALPEAASSLDRATQQQPEQEREFEQLLGECSRLAYRVALSVLRNSADAEDVAQEAFVRAYRHFAELRERGRFRPWLVRTVWRLAIDRQRSAIRRGRRELEAAASQRRPAGIEGTAVGHEFQRRIEQAVDSLPEKLRRVVILAAIEGYDMRETAKLLGLPEGTVRSRLHRARKLLTEKLR
jgi:RNA polymerase sigma-70 factor, ECF subfamily